VEIPHQLLPLKVIAEQILLLVMEVGVEVRLALEARLTEVLLLQIALQVLLFTTLVVEVLVQITPQPAV
jgi:hypothetical protein